MTSFFMGSSNVYECSDGYSVEVLGRTGLAYREEGRCLFMDSEVLAPPARILVYRDSIRDWRPPHQEQALGVGDRSRILGNILKALESQGIDVQVL